VAIHAASTYAIGKVFLQHFESRNTMLTSDPEKVRVYYAERVVREKVEALRRYAGVDPCRESCRWYRGHSFRSGLCDEPNVRSGQDHRFLGGGVGAQGS